MNTNMRCPTCGSHLKRVEKEEKDRLPLDYPDEDVYYCLICCEYIYEADFLFNTEE
jgi:uncharacterized protein with PIN domain